MAQRVRRSHFVEQLEQEPDLDASEASPQEAQAAAAALAEAARQAVATSSKPCHDGSREKFFSCMHGAHRESLVSLDAWMSPSLTIEVAPLPAISHDRLAQHAD